MPSAQMRRKQVNNQTMKGLGNKNMMVRTMLVLSAFSATALLRGSDSDYRRLADANAMLEEMMEAPDRSVPLDVLRDAKCAVLVPGLKKAGLIIGAKYGRGYAMCHTEKGWSAPVAVRIEGGSVGFQIGASETDILLLVMNKRGMDRLLSSQFTLGGEASVAAGPVGRESQAQTDITLRAEILSWSRSRGVFAGIALQGATLREDSETDRAVYGHEVNRGEVLNGAVDVPKPAEELVATLARLSAPVK
jgi:SH3 domain-containing YSC84-like protein 1